MTPQPPVWRRWWFAPFAIWAAVSMMSLGAVIWGGFQLDRARAVMGLLWALNVVGGLWVFGKWYDSKHDKRMQEHKRLQELKESLRQDRST